MKKHSAVAKFMAVCAACLLACGAALGQVFPAKPVRLVVPFPPGGIDTQARALAQKMSEDLGQPVIIENRAGANGNIGTEFVARSAADGHTLLFTSSSTMVIGLFVQKSVPFDPFKDFTPIINVYSSLQTVSVPASLPVNTLQELVEQAKRTPGKLSYSSSGIGSWVHLAGETFKQATGTDIVHIPYKGTGPMTADLAAGRVEISFPSFSTAANFLAAGKVKMLALAESQRFSGKPEIPTIGELYPGFQKPPSWIAMYGPAGMPAPIVRRINASAQRSLDLPEVRAFFAKTHTLVLGGTPEEFAATMKNDWDVTEKLIRKLGIQPE